MTDQAILAPVPADLLQDVLDRRGPPSARSADPLQGPPTTRRAPTIGRLHSARPDTHPGAVSDPKDRELAEGAVR
jgi:hypothetical protein